MYLGPVSKYLPGIWDHKVSEYVNPSTISKRFDELDEEALESLRQGDDQDGEDEEAGLGPRDRL